MLQCELIKLTCIHRLVIEPAAANVSSLEVFGRIYDEGTWSRHEFSKVRTDSVVRNLYYAVVHFCSRK